jgi:CDP-6-deoxy-D-xylo-4-hexulose-3-dehydrase
MDILFIGGTGNVLRQPMMKNVKYVGNADDFVNADIVMKQGILLACHHGLNDEMIDHLYESIDLFISQYT